MLQRSTKKQAQPGNRETTTNWKASAISTFSHRLNRHCGEHAEIDKAHERQHDEERDFRAVQGERDTKIADEIRQMY
jgi:hypothetical protein